MLILGVTILVLALLVPALHALFVVGLILMLIGALLLIGGVRAAVSASGRRRRRY